MQRKQQQSDDYDQAFGDSGKEKRPFNRKKFLADLGRGNNLLGILNSY